MGQPGPARAYLAAYNLLQAACWTAAFGTTCHALLRRRDVWQEAGPLVSERPLARESGLEWQPSSPDRLVAAGLGQGAAVLEVLHACLGALPSGCSVCAVCLPSICPHTAGARRPGQGVAPSGSHAVGRTRQRALRSGRLRVRGARCRPGAWQLCSGAQWLSCPVLGAGAARLARGADLSCLEPGRGGQVSLCSSTALTASRLNPAVVLGGLRLRPLHVPCRYPWYLCSTLGEPPWWLTWLRYTAFIPLYPAGTLGTPPLSCCCGWPL